MRYIIILCMLMISTIVYAEPDYWDTKEEVWCSKYMFDDSYILMCDDIFIANYDCVPDVDMSDDNIKYCINEGYSARIYEPLSYEHLMKIYGNEKD